jgi:tripartite-type tricarboxylate transporter receptor subunit TctC
MMSILSKKTVSACVLMAGALTTLSALAFPDHPVTIVVPATPGSLTDLVARVMTPRLSQLWSQPVIVENRPGASSLIGTQYTMKQKPDGHTLMLATVELATMPALNKRAQLDVIAGLDAVARIGSLPMVVLASNQFPATTYAGAAALFKASPGKYTYASNGTGSIMQLYAEMFKREAGVNLLHVPYRGGPEASRALLANEVDVEIQIANGNILGYLSGGKAKALAIGSPTRLKALPDVPTTAELGMPQLQMEVWYGMFAPAGMPKDLLDRLNTDIATVLHAPEVQGRLRELGMDVQTEAQAAFSQYFNAEHKRWTRLIAESGIQVN